ncbi:MAG: flavin reductase family protein [Oscillospiraceae bacterium]|nr:flavin reductase family protein [Oscillospiraceae bacterium]
MFYEPEKNNHGLKHNPFKSCTVPRAIGWISTLSKDNVANLAPYSQFTNLSFDPPYVMVAINQAEGRRKDTTVNIEETGEFVYNMVSYELKDKMNITSIGYEPEVDEFELAGLTKAPCENVRVPRVGESPVSLECKYVQTIRLPGYGTVGTVDMIIGKVVGVHIKDEVLGEEDRIDIEKIKPLARLGYSYYTVVEKVFELEDPPTIGDKGAAIANGLEGNFGAFR